jgi:hypothetical protein
MHDRHACPPVFIAMQPSQTLHPKEWAPMEHQKADDELVYPVSSRAAPLIRFTRHLVGKKSLRFEGLLARCYVDMLLYSGATHSFVSAMYLQNNHICCESVAVPNDTLADGSSVNVVGMLRNAELKMGGSRIIHELLVVEMEVYDCVLGMSFLHACNPQFDWRARTMSVPHEGTILTIRLVPKLILQFRIR